MSLTISQLNPLFIPDDVIRDPSQTIGVNTRPKPIIDNVNSNKPFQSEPNFKFQNPISLSTHHQQQVEQEKKSNNSNNLNQVRTELSSLFNLESLEHIKPKRKKLDNSNSFQFIAHYNTDSEEEEEKTPATRLF